MRHTEPLSAAERRWTAAALLEWRRDQAKAWARTRAEVPWYMMNLAHPAVRELYEEDKRKAGIVRMDALGDVDRMDWELSLMSGETQRRLYELARMRSAKAEA